MKAVAQSSRSTDVVRASLVTVRCYNNGLWKVCPNPQDEDRVKSLKKAYEQGNYISYEDVTISQADFNNPENWNS